MDLDKEFQNLKADGALHLTGKELVEDRFIVARQFLRRQVVEPASGARYFGDSLKIPDSDHFSICKPNSNTSAQHRILLRFIVDNALQVAPPKPIPADFPEQSDSGEVADVGDAAPLTTETGISDMREITRTKTSIVYLCTYAGQPAILKRTDRAVCNIDALRILVEVRERMKNHRYGLATEIAVPLRVWEEGQDIVELQPFAEGVTLESMVHRSRPYRLQGILLAEIFDSLLTVLEELHEVGILHRDVNPSNLLIAAHDHGLQLTLIDCTSAWPTNVFPQVPIGNPAFTPPEQMEGHACKQSDWYSLAATCFFAANGEAPVLAQQERLLAGLRNTHILDEMEFEGSKRADDYGLLASLLEARPENRPQKYFTLKPKTGTRMAPSRFESLDSVMDLGVAGNVFIPGTGSYGQSWEAVPASKLAKVVARAREQLQIEGRQMQEFLAAQMREKAAN